LGLLYGAWRFTSAYADNALVENFAFPGGEFVAWVSSCLLFATLTLGVFLILLFPEGQLPSRWWRLVAWAALFGAALVTLGTAFIPDFLIVTHPYVGNPFGIVGVIVGGFTTYDLFGASRFLGITLLLTSGLAALISLILRLHHTRGIECQQLKWFLFAAVPLTLFLGLIELDLLVLNLSYDFYLRFDFLFNNGTSIFPSWETFSVVRFVAFFALLSTPVFTYIAMLKYRLYDIDLAINRTLVYGALGACVIGIYVLAVVALGALFQAQGNLGVSLGHGARGRPLPADSEQASARC
jgi:hypothetical protein